MSIASFKDRLLGLLDTCSERRVAIWRKERGVGIDSVNAAWVEDVFWDKSWREVKIPESDVLLDWLGYLPISELPKMLPAILERCCDDIDNQEAPIDLLLSKSRYHANPGGWDPGVIQCLDKYMQEFADEHDRLNILRWRGVQNSEQH